MDTLQRIIVFSLGCMLFASCSSTRDLAIEYQRPAEITFPQNVTRVLVINNTVSQDSTFGVKYTLNRNPAEPIAVPVDSAAFFTVNMLGHELDQNNFFTKVAVLSESLRGDKQFELPGRLDNSLVNELALQAGADAIISLDHQLYNTHIGLIDNNVGLKNGNIKVRGFSLFNVYIPFRENTHLASIRYVDSLSWRNDDVDTRNGDVRELITSEYANTVVCATGNMIGRKIVSKIIPTWVSDNRRFYTSYQTEWKAATANIRKDRWDEAVSIWEKIYNRSSSVKNKAKAASNIAVVYELNDNYNEALDWVNKALEVLKTNGSDGESSLHREINTYHRALQKRLDQSKYLDTQLRY